MNENFEKIDFSSSNTIHTPSSGLKAENYTITNYMKQSFNNTNESSFYNFTKNPKFGGDFNFFENVHINFNINNLILTHKDEEMNQMEMDGNNNDNYYNDNGNEII